MKQIQIKIPKYTNIHVNHNYSYASLSKKDMYNNLECHYNDNFIKHLEKKNISLFLISKVCLSQNGNLISCLAKENKMWLVEIILLFVLHLCLHIILEK